MSEASGTTSGRKDSECGAMGVSSAHGTEGATMGPPADREYAVDPDGVAIISPSACVPRTPPSNSPVCMPTLPCCVQLTSAKECTLEWEWKQAHLRKEGSRNRQLQVTHFEVGLPDVYARESSNVLNLRK